jgi:protease-4
MAASGGYYIGCSADKIYADPTCITGSIGVIVQTLNFSVLMEKMGVSVETIKSGEVKDMMSPYKPMSDAEREIMKSIVDEYYERFVGIVAEARKMPVEEAKTVGDARIYTAKQALEVGLVDSVARVNEVYADIRNDLGDVSFVTWRPLPTFIEMLGGYQARNELRDALKLLPSGRTPVFMYMWNGGVAPFAVSAPIVVDTIGQLANGQEEK